VVFALDAPYFLDATEISNISVYYGLYSKQPQFIEVAARLLFKELTAPGDSPVSVSSVGYNLTTALSPDPNRSYSLTINPAVEDEIIETPLPEGEPAPEDAEEYFVGDPIIIQTGAILDHNGHPVGDDIPTKFILTTTNIEGNTSQREINTVTLNGKASTSFVLDTPGTLRIQASSGTPEALSTAVSLDVTSRGDGGGGVIVVVTETPSPDSSPFLIPTPEPGEPVNINATLEEGRLHPVHWFLLVLVAAFASLFAYQVGAVAGQVRWGVRWALTSFIGGLLVVSYLAFGLGGSEAFIMKYTLWGIVIGTLAGNLVGWGLGVLWRNLGK
jgi:beta-N-acetylhexosaminidase